MLWFSDRAVIRTYLQGVCSLEMITSSMKLILLCLCSLRLSVEASKQRLLIVLLDGMRWDYVERDSTLKAFQRIAKEGVRAQYVTPIFPSISYPNWYTIVTGLYVESHGMIGNHMYDSTRKDSFDMSPDPKASHEHWWNKTEPLWVTAEKNGRHAAMHYWDGCQVPIFGVEPHVCDNYKSLSSWNTSFEDTNQKLRNLVHWFERSKINKLAMVYYERTDDAGHKYGPDSRESFQAVREADDMLQFFLNRLEQSKVKDDVNLIVLSDHGMADVHSFEVHHLDDFDISDKIEKSLAGGAYAAILPKRGREQEVYRILKERNVKGLHVYLREEIPERYHYKKGELTFPILVVADIGHYIALPGWKRSLTPSSVGTHGFDPYVENSTMRTIMYAKGPAFKQGVVGGPIEQTDHYNVFCHILNIKPLPNNGSWDRVKELLVVPERSATSKILQGNLFAVSLSIILMYIKNKNN